MSQECKPIGDRVYNRRKFTLRIVILAFIASMVPAGNEAHATPYPLVYNNVFFVPDDAAHSFCFTSGISSTHQQWISDSMQYLDSVTSMYDVAHGTQCMSTTDVVWFVVNGDPNTPLGSTYCVDPGVFNCRAFWVVVDIDDHNVLMNECGNDTLTRDLNFIQSLRHELGHSTGLTHYSPSGGNCDGIAGDDSMTSDWIPYSSYDWTDYNNHHIAEVNCFCQQ